MMFFGWDTFNTLYFPLKLPPGSQTVSDARSCFSVPSWPVPGEIAATEEWALSYIRKAIVRERESVLARPCSWRLVFHGAGLRIKDNIALSGVLMVLGNNSSWISCQELSKE